MIPHYPPEETFWQGVTAMRLRTHPGMPVDALYNAFVATYGCTPDVAAGIWRKLDPSVVGCERAHIRHFFWTLYSYNNSVLPDQLKTTFPTTADEAFIIHIILRMVRAIQIAAGSF